MKTLALKVILLVGLIAWSGPAFADEVPITGTVKAVDATAQTFTLTTTAKGRARQVVVDVKPDTRIVRFVRSSDPGTSGHVERAATLAEIKPGWTVSVTTKHAGDREVAEIVKVVHEP